MAGSASSKVAKGVAWGLVYVVLTLAPLALVLASAELGGNDRGTGRSFWTELSVALGFVGLSMMCLQFVLTARFERLKAPYGSDVIYAFHRAISVVSVVLILLHPALLFATRWEAMLERPFTHPWPFGLGTASVVCLLALVVVSVWRKRLGIGYDWWRRGHAALAILAVATGVAHVVLVGHYLAEPWQRGLWIAYSLAWVGLIVYVRLAKPVMEMRRPYRVVAVEPQRGRAVRLAIEPEGHAGLVFQPGQFAWITMFDSPFSDREHPFSFSGSAAALPRLEFTIKELGDWTRRVREAKVGQRVYVDGPFGALSADRHPSAEAFVLIAGGIGITPMISHLRTFADRGETRAVWLFYAGKSWDELTYREELVALLARVPSARVVFALAREEDAAGARAEIARLASPGVASRVAVDVGFVDGAMLSRHAPGLGRGVGSGGATPLRAECFICGPVPMMEAVERALAGLGVRVGDFHSERFDLV